MTTVEIHQASSSLPPQQSVFEGRLRALDGLRGVAILAVLFFHYAGGIPKQSHSVLVGSISVAIGFGWTGVDLFFVLSGFLITGILYDTRDDPRYYINFYARRALRIFPIFFLLIAIYLSLTPILHLHWKPGHLFFLVYLGYPAALLWPDLQITSPFVPIVHLWSLCAEEQFYLVWPWVIARLRSGVAILWTCAALASGAIVLRTMLLSQRLDPSWAYGFLPCRMDTLAMGASLAILVRSSWYLRVQRWSLPCFAVAVGVLAMICGVRHTVDRYDFAMATIGYSVIAVAYGALLLSCLKKGSVSERVFSWKLLRIFGKYSYALYIYHLSLAAVLHPLKDYLIAETRSFLTGSAAYLVLALAINLAVASLSFQLFESPILRLKARFQS